MYLVYENKIHLPGIKKSLFMLEQKMFCLNFKFVSSNQDMYNISCCIRLFFMYC